MQKVAPGVKFFFKIAKIISQSYVKSGLEANSMSKNRQNCRVFDVEWAVRGVSCCKITAARSGIFAFCAKIGDLTGI